MKRKTHPKKEINISLDEFKDRVRTADLNAFFIFGAIILILGIGLYAIFSPTAKNSRLGNPACGKIVVAADGPSLKADVSPTLSGAKYFLVINPLSKKLLESAKNPYMGIQSSRADVAYFVAGKAEEAVIAGSIESQNYKILTQFDIRGFGGYNGKVRDAVELYRQARISQGVQPVANQHAASRHVAFGLGKQSYICPVCNWRLQSSEYKNTYPNCPNCGSPMAKNMPDNKWQNTFNKDNFGLAANTVPIQNNSNLPQPNPNFWQGPESTGFFICPKCNWHMYAQKDMGEFPKCPNCKAIMARSGVIDQNAQNQGLNIQRGAQQPYPVYPPPIDINARMPHDFRGVCSNCHQIIRQPQGNIGAQGINKTSPAWDTTAQRTGVVPAAWSQANGGGKICILK